MKEIFDNVWNASPSAILTPINDAVTTIVILYAASAIFGIGFFIYIWRKLR